ncbi:MAG: hypothetical protein CMK59_10655 [Proteobacteria bacterium]|nr:hypothetical protein [Pseudomonadota bacterium]
MLLLLLACREDHPPTPKETAAPAVELIDYVNPIIATGGVGYWVNCGFPGAGRPLGMVKVSPDTATSFGSADGFYRGGGYHYDDTQIQGFSHMHLYATGLTDYGVLAAMPTDGMTPEKTHRDGYGANFSHDEEWAEPGYYAVHFQGIEVELSATDHTALHEYRFDSSIEDPTVLLDLGHSMGRGKVLEATLDIADDGQSFSGDLIMDGEMSDPFRMYFYGTFELPPTSWGVWNEDELFDQSSISTIGDDVELGGWFSFEPDSTVRMRIALSNLSVLKAQSNFEAQHSGFDINQDREAALAVWRDKLNAIQVWGGDEAEREIFATALYHTLMMPTLFSDHDHEFLSFGGVTRNEDRPFYTDFSLWDTYRTVHPLYTLLWPDLHVDLLWSLTQMALDGGGLPRWPLANTDAGVMLGTSVNIVTAEAYLKGLSGFDESNFYTFSKNAMLDREPLNFGNPPNLTTYEELGYWPEEEHGRSVAWAQEQSIADYALAQMGLSMGDSVDANHLLARSENWRNLWDPQIEWFHGRKRDGSFGELISESAWDEDFTEGNARQYLWLVPHNPEGLFETIGGTERTLERLHEFFDEMEDADIEAPGAPESWYWHGNEPDIHVPFFFALATEPQSTDRWVDWIQKNRYSATPDGLAGNDDGGTLSAWYVLSSIGLYPLAGTDRYVLTTPIWDRTEFNLQEKSLTIEKNGSGIRSEIQIGGTKWTSPDVTHSQLEDILFVLE